MTDPKFKIGDRVTKRSGYRFTGEVISVFHKRSGQVRIVVENADEILHIFNEDQMERVNGA
jgi:hypothetical protein